MSGGKVLVTGATGFIGGRLVEKLILERGAQVRALVKNFGRASRIARFDLEMVPGGIADGEAVDRAVQGCDVVFHCAHDFSNPPQNLEGARRLAEACARHAVRRLVHVSSISVYEPLPDGDLDESSPAEPCGWTYPDNKLAVEQFLLEFGKQQGLPIVVLQPTIVYGPFSGAWTVGPVSKLRTGRVALPSDREGWCSAVYIDDVADALILAADKEQAVGERFLISGPDWVTWNEFYRAYERMLGVHSLVWMTTPEIQALNGQHNETSKLWLLRQDPRRLLQWAPLRPVYHKLRANLISETFATRVRNVVPSVLHYPNEVELALYRARTVVNISKARRLLGYEPAFTFDRGINLTAQYVAWASM